MTISSTFRSRLAQGTIAAFAIVKDGSADMTCVVGAAATDKLIGTNDSLAHVTGEMVDVSVDPIAEVVLGGPVARGDALTSNASGAAITTTTAGNRIIGFAEMSGVSGDVIRYVRQLGVY